MMNSFNEILNEDSHLSQNLNTMELKSFISQAKKDDIELVKSIGRTVEQFTILWQNNNITHKEFARSIENILDMKRLSNCKFSERNKSRITHIIEELNNLLILKIKN